MLKVSQILKTATDQEPFDPYKLYGYNCRCMNFKNGDNCTQEICPRRRPGTPGAPPLLSESPEARENLEWINELARHLV